MKATLLLEANELFTTRTGRTVEIQMDLYQLSGTSGRDGNDYRFSWIAFDTEDPMRRILFDCHPPKGPHFLTSMWMETRRGNHSSGCRSKTPSDSSARRWLSTSAS
jgi:hypothetical protein